MSITFTSGLIKPNNLPDTYGLPNRFYRPAFEELYGFDVPPPVVGLDGALLTEPVGDTLVTELDEPIAFEPA